MSADKEQIISLLNPKKIDTEVTIPNPTQIEHIELSKDKIPEPLNAYRVSEGRYATASFSPERPYLITYGLSACKAVVIYDSKAHKGLIAHLSIIKDLNGVITGLFSEFQGDLDQATISIAVGSSEGTGDTANFGAQKHRYWPSLERLVNTIVAHHPKTIQIDDKYSTHPKGIALNLETGAVKEIDNLKGWTWSNQQDTSINRKLDELEKAG